MVNPYEIIDRIVLTICGQNIKTKKSEKAVEFEF
jgi:hypothetical protein